MAEPVASATASFRPGRRTIAILLVAAVLLGAGAWMLWSRPTDRERARDALARGDLPAAIARFESHLAQHPADSRSRLELGLLLKDRDPDAALAHWGGIPAGSSEYPLAMRHIAELALLSGKDDVAEPALLALHEQDEADHAVQLSLAELYFRNGRPEEALPFARRAAELRPERAGTWLLTAEILDDLNRTGEMIGPLRKAIEADPGLYAAHLNLAYACRFAGDLDCAEREARWCIARNNRDAAAHRVLAAVARDQGRAEEALQHVERALQLDPADLQSRLLEADLLLFLRRPQEAYERLKPLYAEHRQDRNVLGPLARAAMMAGHRDDARRYQQEIMRLIPEEQESTENGPQ